MPSISVVIVNYNSERFLRKNLESLQAQSEPFSRIIVVDNKSSDNSIDLINEFKGVSLIPLNENIGYSAALNRGIEKCDSDLILVANSDIYIEKKFNRIISDKFEVDPDLDIASPLILRFGGEIVDSAGQFYSTSLYPAEAGFGAPAKTNKFRESIIFSVCGAATVFRRKSLERLKVEGEYYDESYFMFWEDFDISWRPNLYGMKIKLLPDAEVFHFRGGTLKKSFLTRFSMALVRPGNIKYHLVKNRYLTLIKNFRFRTFWYLIPVMVLKDLVWVGLLTLSSPKIIIKLLMSGSIFKAALRRRKVIKNNE